MFVELDDDRLLRSHLGMWGSWHVYAPAEPWQKPRRQGSIVLDTGERVFVSFNAVVVESTPLKISVRSTSSKVTLCSPRVAAAVRASRSASPTARRARSARVIALPPFFGLGPRPARITRLPIGIDSASDQSTIVRQADLSIVKSGAATAVAGEPHQVRSAEVVEQQMQVLEAGVGVGMGVGVGVGVTKWRTAASAL